MGKGVSFRVRRAAAADAVAVADVYVRARHHAVPDIPPLPGPDDWVREWLTGVVLSGGEVWIAEMGDAAVVGLLLLEEDRIEQLYTDPGWTGRGVGAALLDVAKRSRPDGLQLWTFETNLRAHRFYERHGFVAAERTDGSANQERSPDVRFVWRPLSVRGARGDDGPSLRAMEEQAGRRFRELGLDEVADDEPLSSEVLGRYAAAGRCWVAVDAADEPVGYVLVDLVDADAHVEQVSVRPDHQGRGVARALLACVRAWAAERGCSGVTLTTFTHVPWNRPLFEHLGFRVLAVDETASGLRAVRAAEAARSLDPSLRVCMRWDLSP